MTDAATLRDSTEIVLAEGAAEELREALEEEFVVTVVEEGWGVRIVGSPVEIKRVSDFLARNGIGIQ